MTHERSSFGRSETNIMAVRKSVTENPKTSIHHRAEEFDNLTITFHRILH